MSVAKGCAGIALALCIGLLMITPANAATIGSNLASAPNGSVCSFQSFQPETRICTIDQTELVPEHAASDGLVAPFDGIVTSWSVVSGLAPPGTGNVRVSLRARGPKGYDEKGPEVELPSGPPGTRHTFAERLPIAAEESISLRIAMTNRSTQEAGVPIAFQQTRVGTLHVWEGEPWESSRYTEEDTELLLSAEIEPDNDGDGFGDLTQDCFPNHPGDQHLCGVDFIQPTIRHRVPARQGFLRSGVIRVPVASSEAGQARAAGRLEIQGSKQRSFALRAVRKPVLPNTQVTLQLQVPKGALKVARAAAADGKKIAAKVQIRVADAAGNVRPAAVRVRPK